MLQERASTAQESGRQNLLAGACCPKSAPADTPHVEVDSLFPRVARMQVGACWSETSYTPYTILPEEFNGTDLVFHDDDPS